jgi:F-type H+-transporting ATPase subunit a
MLVLVLGGILVTRRLSLVPSATQATFELVVDTVDSHIRDTMRVEPVHYRAFIGTLFVFIFVANWSLLVPGVEPPTAHLETDAALALLVFMAVIWFGIRAGGVRGYLATSRRQTDHDPTQLHREPDAQLLLLFGCSAM